MSLHVTFRRDDEKVPKTLNCTCVRLEAENKADSVLVNVYIALLTQHQVVTRKSGLN